MHREDVDVITRLISQSSALLVGEADSISSKAVEEVISSSHIAAALPWSDLTPEALESASAQAARLPSALRVGSLKDEAFGSMLIGGNAQETPRLESRCRATDAMAAEIFHECGSRIEAGANAAALLRGLQRAADEVCAQISKDAKAVTDTNEIAQVAAFSAKGNKVIGQIIVDAMQQVGKDGAITVEEGTSVETTLDVTDGMHFDQGYLSTNFVTDVEKMEAVLEGAYVLVYGASLDSFEALRPLLEAVAKSGRPLLLIVTNIDHEVLSTLAGNKVCGTLLSLCVVKAPGAGDLRQAMLEDIAILTGARLLSHKTTTNLDQTSLEDLGKAKRVVVDKDATVIVDSDTTSEHLVARIAQIREEIEQTASDAERQTLQERLAKLAGGVAVVTVGAKTEAARLEKMQLVETALHAAYAAVEEGVVPSYGVSLLRGQRALDALKLNDTELVGAHVLRRALQVPLERLLKEAGKEPSPIVQEVKSRSGAEGYNITTSTYEDLVKVGAIEPSKTVRESLQDAVRISTARLTAESGRGEKKHESNEQEMAAPAFPALLPISKRKGLFFRSPDGGGAKSETLLQSVALRAICSLPIGCAQVHLIDLQTKGRAFANLSGLDVRLAPAAPITPQAVTTLLHGFEKRVADVNRRCLSRHEWLCDYNAANPDEPEPYYFICLSDFPKGLEKESVEAIDRLLAHECAARAGMYLFFSSEQALPKSPNFSGMPVVFTDGGKAELQDSAIDTSSGSEFAGLMLVPDKLPKHIGGIIDMLNRAASAKPKVKKVVLEVDSSQIWSGSAGSGISVPIGKNGRQEVNFRLGNDASVHHALIGGATGKGKTVLLHNLILNAADLYSPEDLQMILMDFKEGTEFACYEGLPHMRVLSIASELHFGQSVFEWLVAERMRRASSFKKVGVANLADYMNKTGEKLPRILVLMDEFQRLLSDGNIGPQVSILLDDIVRTGRSFGINLVLSTQSLANVNIETSTLEQLGLRICLQLSEQEASRFLGYDNIAPAAFSRPGQAIYNEVQGRKEGNTEFQVAFIDAGRIPERCAGLREREAQHFGRLVIEEARVFHGEQPINPVGRFTLMATDKLHANIGEPLKIQADPISIILEQQDGANVLCVGQSLEILQTIANNLAVQFVQSSSQPEIFVSDGLPLGKERWANSGSRKIKFLPTPTSLNDVLDQLSAELETRKMNEQTSAFPPKLLFLVEPQLNKAFPPSNGMDSSPAALKVNALLEQGARFGIYIVLITSRLARADKVLGPYGNRINQQHFANKIVFRSDEAEGILGFETPSKNIGQYSGVAMNEATGEATPFQIYDSINPQTP